MITPAASPAALTIPSAPPLDGGLMPRALHALSHSERHPITARRSRRYAITLPPLTRVGAYTITFHLDRARAAEPAIASARPPLAQRTALRVAPASARKLQLADESAMRSMATGASLSTYIGPSGSARIDLGAKVYAAPVALYQRMGHSKWRRPLVCSVRCDTTCDSTVPPAACACLWTSVSALGGALRTAASIALHCIQRIGADL